MKNKIEELIKALEKQQVTYEQIIRETKCTHSDAFFGGKIAGLFDEIQNLKNLLEEEPKTFEVTYLFKEFRSVKVQAKTEAEAKTKAQLHFEDGGWGWSEFDYGDDESEITSIEEVKK